MANGSGYVFKRADREGWWARLTFRDPVTGKRKNIVRQAPSKNAATDILRRLTRELEDAGGRSFDYERATFADLAAYFEATYVKPAEFRDGRKISGLRSEASTCNRLELLRAAFGTMLLRSVRRYRDERLSSITRRGTPPAIATVNRELQLLRRMFNVAAQEGWILRNPFSSGDRLISPADEKKRERILSLAEEELLLASCYESHLRPIVICALDTGMRQGEILKLKWADVDLEGNTITIVAMNTKTLTERTVPMTTRLRDELSNLRRGESSNDVVVFGIRSNVKRSFTSACRRAGLSGLRFHDLRHTAGTRLVQGGLELAEVGRLLGHTQFQTTYRYVNRDNTTLSRAVSILEAVQAEQTAAVN